MHLFVFSTTSRLDGEYLQNEMRHRQSGKGVGNYKGSPTSSQNFVNLMAYKRLKCDRSFYPPFVNSAFCFVARRHTQQRSDSNFSKRKVVNCADASRIGWRRVVNVNETIEIRSLLSRGLKNILSKQ